MTNTHDSINWCPDCGEPREVCISYGQCQLGKEAKAQEGKVWCWGKQFCPHPGEPCIDGCYFCGRAVGALNGDHNHTNRKRVGD